ncbi:MAG: hypothetical protein A3I77_03110 [Gammaproteobacteria bacterium RIFCSPLOWO2_02_FULL_42_14]|nr:MAG: hypothetical protein A3B71_01090 [Gammaproteobacteria bacterium RIFCSPHIGHO2_02_FULL_42_43]OGT28790.1 MAG: hypothetical protein A2624_01380 [Gammaproteobacteria bacterium RIFCSPHIGHO2_01_FULL_42_8]OGT51661.1 MAG: hypothetical protein A3E54_03305 [Gammaproteobacteria bacterium RIFCSPHIGHO2_12_FULL_41_25]OGT61559.1 MAG: hypothetical protein A3I77_03110 [Gammaproteobacteria bacterium RIFCSPLOWO2_02_FULL_42_14]OGT86182.1 MAG: hypothetical protein A3G86_05960 [Gammaproteobacteria bacterium R
MKFYLSFVCFCIIFLSTIIFAKDNEQAAMTNARLGLAYLDKNMYPVSRERLLTAIQDDPHIAVSWYSMAYYLEKTDDKVNAEKYYLKAIAVDPHSGAAKNDYGAFLCRMGRYDAGLQQFNAAVSNPSYVNIAEAYENAGICSLMKKDNTLAYQYFHKALSNNPNLPFTLLSLARLSHEKGDDQNANHYFSYLIKLESLDKSPTVLERYRRYVFQTTASNIVAQHNTSPT